MGYAELARIASEWDEITHTVLDLEKFSLTEMQVLLKETYIVLTAFHKEEFVPKGISKILLNMDAFLYFASLMENKEVAVDFYWYQESSMVVSALKQGFFRGKYECAFPKLRLLDLSGNASIVDLEEDCLFDANADANVPYNCQFDTIQNVP